MRKIEYAGRDYEVSEAHRAADALPWNLDNDEFAALVANMSEDGFDQDRPVTRLVDTTLIIDGRRRELAAIVAGVEPVYRTVNWTEEQIIQWVQRDLTRRNLTASQIAASAVELADLMPHGGNRKIKGHQCPLNRTSAEISSETGVGEKTIDAAAKVKKKAPELLAAVKEGDLSAKTAAQVADLPRAERKKVAKAKDKKKAAKDAIAKAKATEPEAEATPAEPGAEFVATVESLCRDVDQIAARMKALKESPLAYSIHIDSAVSQVEAARKTLWQGRPAHICPYCKGQGCDTCKKTGRVKKNTFDSGTKAMGGVQ
jgi:hypothetical protein